MITPGREYDREVQESETEVDGHVKRQNQEYDGGKTLKMIPPGRRSGRPKQRWMDCVNWDTRAIGTTTP